VGAKGFYIGMADDELRLVRRILDIMRSGIPVPSLKEIELSDAVFVVGEDVSTPRRGWH
jgi:NADH-quinone oxidoreductase subunit G